MSRPHGILMTGRKPDLNRVMSTLRPFHIAVPVNDLATSRAFYIGVLGCREGRSDEHWVDFDLFGHQFVCHLRTPATDGSVSDLHHNEVDGERVPVPHYGVVLTMAGWQKLATRLTEMGQEFVIEPTIRFAGQPGEQATFFILDPSGNALEFKGFKSLSTLFVQ
jgi:extradiol dioxygenase family protein